MNQPPNPLWTNKLKLGCYNYLMERQEKKYLVDSFSNIQKTLDRAEAKKGQEIVAIHYYGQHKGNDVEKFVEYTDRYEIHILKESDGRFTLTEHSPIPDKEAGIAWLKGRKYTTANIVKMAYTEYEHKNGTIGLYIIDDFLHSVILYYPPGAHEAIEKEFGLQTAKVITVPYNKLLEQLGRLRSMQLN